MANAGYLQCITGRVPVESLGLILPHEHLFTDLRGPLDPGYAQEDPEEVARVMGPYLASAHAAGVTALVECSTLGVGRNVAVLRRLAQATPIAIVAPTGVYREAFTPPALREAGAAALAQGWVRDLREGMEGTSARAGFIKVATTEGGPTALEVRILQAAALAGRETGAAVACHTVGGEVVRREMAVLESAALDLDRFIWVHAQTEPDHAIHIEAARRGAYVELDSIGAPGQSADALLDAVVALIEAGCAARVLLSHDAGWYQPGRPGGQPEGGLRGYTGLVEDFIPALRARGVGEALVHLMTVVNPARAFAFEA